MPMAMHPDQIGGARVLRTFKFGDRQMRMGETLTGDEVRSMRILNRNSLVEKNFLVLWPKEAAQSKEPVQAVNVTRFVVPLAFGRGYNVIEGRLLNDEPLSSKEEAHKLAGLPLPEGNGKTEH